MPIISWNNNMSVKVAEIDKQHQKLVDMINDIHDAMRQRKAKDILGDIIAGLGDYAVKHFTHEEKYFARFNYPDSAAHKKEHDDFFKTQQKGSILIETLISIILLGLIVIGSFYSYSLVHQRILTQRQHRVALGVLQGWMEKTTSHIISNYLDPNDPGVNPDDQKVRSASVLLPRDHDYDDGARDATRVRPGEPHVSV